MTLQKPVILVFSSHVAAGAVGNRASVFVLELLGFEVWAVPTIQMAWHPGNGPSKRLVPDEDEFAAHISDLSSRISKDTPIAILTGYLGSSAQATPISKLIDKAHTKGAVVHYLCDPVMGDNGGLYVPVETAKAIRDQLLPLADTATPNRFELSWLLGETEAHSIGEAADQAQRLGPATVLATSIPAMMKGSVANLLVSAGKAHTAEHRLVDVVPNGTGDLTAALYLAHLLNGARPEQAMGSASAAVFALISQSKREAGRDFKLARDQGFLRRPLNMPVLNIVTTKPR
ncbi:MAG: pyridoxal kinase [Pseudomonadota bacterium]